MACIVYTTDAAGRQYAYSSESHWNKEKKQSRSKRTYLGRVNPETGEIMKGRQNGKNYKRPADEPVASHTSEEFLDELQEKTSQLAALQEENQKLREQVQNLSMVCRDIAAALSKAGIG